ncbi:hypothetical protein NDU88_008028, partial [Pleurodeles waltl]
CPCSPLHFALYIDQLIIMLLDNKLIVPMERVRRSVKRLKYADDIDLVSPDPGTTLTEIAKETSKFGEMPGYLLNNAKCQIMINQWVSLE